MENSRKPTTRSDKSNEDDLVVSGTFQPGSIYVVTTGTTAEFRLAKCKKVTRGSVEVNFLVECQGGSESEQYFVETQESGKVPKKSISCGGLISVKLVNCDLKNYSVDRVELEEIIFTLNI